MTGHKEAVLTFPAVLMLTFFVVFLPQMSILGKGDSGYNFHCGKSKSSQVTG